MPKTKNYKPRSKQHQVKTNKHRKKDYGFVKFDKPSIMDSLRGGTRK